MRFSQIYDPFYWTHVFFLYNGESSTRSGWYSVEVLICLGIGANGLKRWLIGLVLNSTQCLSGVGLWSITRMKLEETWSWNESQKSRIKKKIKFHFNSVCSVCSHERYLWNTGTDIQPLKFFEAWILLWNLLLDSFLFDLASYRLWYVPLRVNCILKIVFVLFLSSFTSLSVHIIVNYIRWLPVTPKFFILLFDFALSSLNRLPILATFPKTWHKQKKKKLNHFSEPKTKEDHRLSPPLIYFNWCKALWFQKLNYRRCWFNHIWSQYIIHTSHAASAFSLKWQIITKQHLFSSTVRFHT